VIGLVIITHAHLGRELVQAAAFILGGQPQMTSVSVVTQDDPEGIRQEISQAIGQVDTGEGVLLLTDMFGGTPNNISATLLEPGRVEVVTGVNLPMLLKAAGSREGRSLSELARLVCSAGQEAIAVAGELLAP
jgi:PTS system mannose-specific IIA component